MGTIHCSSLVARDARRQLDLSEPPENGLGYGAGGRSSSSRPEDIREAILRTTKEIITLGASDPEMISLMGFFEDVGPDTISDMTTTVIMDDLAAITETFCQANGVPLFSFDVLDSTLMPVRGLVWIVAPRCLGQTVR